jgi:hypothetical protein
MTRLRLLVVLILLVLLMLAIVMYCTYRPVSDFPIPIIAFVLVASILGSAINETSEHRRAPIPHTRLDLLVYLCWKLLVAFVFAILLYFLFMSKLVTGPLFPEFQGITAGSESADYKNMLDFMTNAKPKANLDAAKIMVWSFIAGYAERLVPNLISKISKAPPIDPSKL